MQKFKGKATKNVIAFRVPIVHKCFSTGVPRQTECAFGFV